MENKVPTLDTQKPSLQDENRLHEARKLVEQIDVFDNIVSHSYLQKLSECEIVSYPADNNDGKLAPMRWFEITKIVVEKNVFFPDKLSMLYMALHSVARNVVLTVEKSCGSKIRLFIGARDFGGIDNVSGEILKSGLAGYLPGIKSKLYTQGTPGNSYSKPYVASVSGIASLRDDKKETFVQGIEKLINATLNIPSFTAYFIADNVSEAQGKSMITAFNELHNQISPLAETQVTMSESETHGVSESFSENFSKSITKNISHTITHTEGFNESTTRTVGSAETKSHTISTGYSTPGLVGLVYGTASVNYSYSNAKTKMESTGVTKGRQSNDGRSDTTGEGNTEQRDKGHEKGTNESKTTGTTHQLTFKNNHATYYLEILDEQIKRIKKGIPFGLWSTAAYFVAADQTTAKTLANLYKGCVVGETSNIESFAVNAWANESDNKQIVKYLKDSQQPRFLFSGINVSAGSVVTSEELAIHLSLPQSSIPGVLVREEESFGRNVISEKPITDDNSIELGVVRHLGVDYEDEAVRLDVNSLSKHAFVTGTTGSGKSNTLYCLISQLADRAVDASKHPEFADDKIKFLIIEPAKGEYKEVFGSQEGVTVYGSNPKVSKLLTINPFVFPEEVDVYEHIDALVEIFNACWPMYAAMPQVLKHAIIEAYKACGWDLVNSCNPFGIYPTVEDVLVCLKEYINASEYSSDTKGDYKGSLETRLQSLCDGIVGRMFNAEPIPDEQLFNANVIIDLSRVKSSETKSLLMGLLVLKLNEFRSSERKGMNLPLRHVTVLEEAHNLLKRTSTDQSAESSNIAGMAVEKIANSMAEMRTFGEGFIIADQSPAMLDPATIRNTNTKIVMALPEKDDREISGKALGLDDEHIEELSRLKTGEAVVYQSGWEEPVKSKVSLYDVPKQTWKFTADGSSDLARTGVHAKRQLADTLLRMYSGHIDSTDINDLIQTISQIRISGHKLYQIATTLKQSADISIDEVAFIFATIVGMDIANMHLHVKDTALFNENVQRGLCQYIGDNNNVNANEFLHMYMRGCSLKSQVPFYDGWVAQTRNLI